jgi:hypothetical protein
MKKILVFVLAAAFLVPSISLAATYQYVDFLGNVKSVEAPNAAEALVTPKDISPHSGVMLVTGKIISPTVKVTTP